MSIVGKTALVILGLIVLIVLVVGGYNAGWWLKKDQTNRQTRIDNNSFSRQSALQQQVLNDVKEINSIDVNIAAADPDTQAAYEKQRLAIVVDMCEAHGLMTGTVNLTPAAETLISQECA